MKIAIYNHGIAFDVNTPSQRPLGGSESGIVYMARELAACGHSVSVYCNCPEAGPAEMYDGVAYVHYHQFFTHYQSAPWDAVIAFRSFDPLLLGSNSRRARGAGGAQKYVAHAINHFLAIFSSS